MNKSYLIRLDDACPTMNAVKWHRMEDILNQYGILPMVGIVPANEDPKLSIDAADANFWDKARAWQSKGWTIALHGYNHVYHQCHGGLNPLWNRSEFVGLSYAEQLEKLKRGKGILESHGLMVKNFFAPSHTFDQNTVDALSEIGIDRISDTVAFAPYIIGDTIFIPQIGGKCRKMCLPGVYTFCFHPNTMNENAFDNLELFLSQHQTLFTNFDALNIDSAGSLSFADHMLRSFYFIIRKLTSYGK